MTVDFHVRQRGIPVAPKMKEFCEPSKVITVDYHALQKRTPVPPKMKGFCEPSKIITVDFRALQKRTPVPPKMKRFCEPSRTTLVAFRALHKRALLTSGHSRLKYLIIITRDVSRISTNHTHPPLQTNKFINPLHIH